MAQTEIVRLQLLAAFPVLGIEIVPLVTTGDRNTDKPLADIGGKGLFTKELEEGLLNGTLDMAVHSLKDMETILPSDLAIGAVLERSDPRDVLIAPKARTLAMLEKGAIVGTSSMRRSAQLRIARRDLNIMPLRGNITTRIAKLAEGKLDATILALAGLKRLGMEAEATEILDTEHFIPAAGQGTIAIEHRESDKEIRRMLQCINHQPTYQASIAERSVLMVLDGSCRTPIAAYAFMEGTHLRLDAMIAKPNGSFYLTTRRRANPSDAQRMGEAAGIELLARGGKDCIA
jgi:hydroxymethylbilane synthase